MSDLRTISRKFLSEFIALYRSHPCLWKIKSKEYSDRNKKNAAYEELRIKLLEIDSEATKDQVVKKIGSLRTCFRKELKKVCESSKSEKGTEVIYRPSLWYYEELTFLVDQELPSKGFSNPVELDGEEDSRNECISRVDESEVSFREENSPNHSNERLKQKVNNSDQDLSPARRENSANHSNEGMKQKVNNLDQNLTPVIPENSPNHSSQGMRQKVDNLDQNMTTVRRENSSYLSSERMKQKVVNSDQNLTQEYKFVLFGKHVAQELQALPQEMALYCKKIINDAIFEAQMGNLNRSSRIVTDTYVMNTYVMDAYVTDTRVRDSYVTDTPVTNSYVMDAYVTDKPVTDNYVIDTRMADNYVTDMHVTDARVIDMNVMDRCETNTFQTNTCVTDTSATDTSVTNTCVMNTSVIDTCVTDTCPSESVTQNQYDPSFSWYIKKRRKSSFQKVSHQ